MKAAWRAVPTGWGTPGAPRSWSWRQEGPSPGAFGGGRGVRPHNTLIPEFWAPELGENAVPLGKPPSLRCFVTAAPGNQPKACVWPCALPQ